jgi:formylglycine-generating enzyme required for sulfatase activity
MEVSEISFHKDAMDLKHPDGYIDSCERVSIPGAETGASPSLVRMKLPEITVDLGDDVKLDLVLIPAGSFMMGEERGNDDEKPVHRVAISQPFYLGKHEVTQEQWHAVMGSNPSRVKGPDYPVENVTWYDCQEFIKRLNEKHGGNRTEYRLPTEAEWEYACRAGSTGAWCFGEDPWQLGDFAWDCFNSYRHDASGGQPHAVGLKLSNAWGLYDMYGNVSEWCADWYDSRYYALSPANDPKGPSSNPMDPRYYGDRRVLRGGSWSGIPTSAARAAGDGRKVYTDRGEHGSDGENGFRVAGTK